MREEVESQGGGENTGERGDRRKWSKGESRGEDRGRGRARRRGGRWEDRKKHTSKKGERWWGEGGKQREEDGRGDGRGRQRTQCIASHAHIGVANLANSTGQLGGREAVVLSGEYSHTH